MVITTAERPLAAALGRNRPAQLTLLAAGYLLASSCAQAAEWKVTPTFDIRETYTDNVRLLPSEQAKGDYVTEITPGLIVTEKSRHLTVNFNWSLQALEYAHKNSPAHTANLAHADIKSELINEHLFLDATGNVTQQNISPFGAQATDIVNATDNRTEVRSFNITPSLRNKFQEWATSDLRYSFDSVNASQPGFVASTADTVALNLKSGKAFRRFTWDLALSDQKIHYKNSDTIEQLSETLNTRLALYPELAVIASVGFEKNSYVALQGAPQGNFYTAGLSWTPSDRSKLEATLGHHYYGDTFYLLGTHRSRNTTWSLNYNDSVTSTRGQFLVPATIDTAGYLNQLYLSTITDPVARQQAVTSIINNLNLPPSTANALNFLSNRYFLQKSFQASVAMNSAKTTTVFSAFNVRREALSSGGVDDLLYGGNIANADNTRQVGISAQWNWRYSGRTQVNVIASDTRTHALSTDRKDENKALRVALTRQFRPLVKGVVEVRRVLGESTLEGAQYRENAIAASLNMQL